MTTKAEAARRGNVQAASELYTFASRRPSLLKHVVAYAGASSEAGPKTDFATLEHNYQVMHDEFKKVLRLIDAARTALDRYASVAGAR